MDVTSWRILGVRWNGQAVLRLTGTEGEITVPLSRDDLARLIQESAQAWQLADQGLAGEGR